MPWRLLLASLVVLLVGVVRASAFVDNIGDDKLEMLDTVKDGEPHGRTLVLLNLLKQKLKQKLLDHLIEKTTSPRYKNCICVPFYLCSANGTIMTDGAGVIDVR